MSTKTSVLKRIARVAVVGLIGSLFTTISVTQTSAALLANNSMIRAITVGSTTTGTAIARKGEAYTRQILVSTGSAGAAAETAQLNFVFTAIPGGVAYSTNTGSGFASSGTVTGGTSHIIDAVAAGSTNGGIFTTASTASASTNVATAGTASAPTKLVIDPSVTDSARAIAGSTSGKVALWSFTPDASGVYKLFIWSDTVAGGNTGVYDSGEVSTTLTITVGDTPASVEIKAASSSAATTDTATFSAGSTGGLFLVRLKDAAGNVTVPNSTESVTLSANVGTLDDTSFTNADFDMSGWAATNLKHTAAGIAVVTATPAGAINTIGAVSAQTTFTAANALATSVKLVNTTGHDQTALAALSNGTAVSFGTNQSSLTFRITTASAASAVAAVQIKDTSGVFTGRKNTTYTLPVSIDDTDSYGSITVTTSGFSTAGSIFGFTGDLSTDVVLTLTSATPVVNAANSSISPTTAQAATGGALTLTATAKDQFKNLINTAVVAWSVSGRNTTSV